MVASEGVGADHFTENHRFEPDIRVDNPYINVLNEQDPQLETAVKEMVKEINK